MIRTSTGRLAAVSIALAALASLVGLCSSAIFSSSPILDFDPYHVLGVGRRASSAKIKAAYRQKAKDTHPDKNPDVDPSESAELFRKVAAAFEVLSDDESRMRYDRQYEAERRREREMAERRARQRREQQLREEQRRRQKEREEKQRKEREERERVRLKNSPAVRRAQSSVIRITSLEQLRTVALDEHGRLERDLLMVFVGNKKVEGVVDDVLLFPYPFAGTGENGGGVQWEDMIRSAKVRYNKQSDLTRYFQAPSNEEMKLVGEPYIVFVRRGDSLNRYKVCWDKEARNKRDKLERWVISQLKTTVTFVNRHRHKVELFKVEGSHSFLAANVPPGGTHIHRNATLGDKFLARDWRVDKFPGGARDFKISEGSTLGGFTVRARDGRIVIEGRECVDLSGHCDRWASSCREMSEFMNGVCASTCGACKDADGNGNDAKSRLFFFWRHMHSLSTMGSLANSMTESFPTFSKDMTHVLDFRKNVGGTIALLGFGLGLAAMLWARRPRFGSISRGTNALARIVHVLFILLPLFCIATSLAARVPPRHVVRGNKVLDFVCMYAVDMKHVMGLRKNAAAAILFAFLLVGMMVGSLASKVLYRNCAGRFVGPEKFAYSRRGGAPVFVKTVMVAASILAAFLCLSAVLVQLFTQVWAIGTDATFNEDMEHVLAFRKNAAFTIVLFGLGIGIRSGLLVGSLAASGGKLRRQRPLAMLERMVEVALVGLPLCCSLVVLFLGQKRPTRGGYERGMELFMRVYKADLMHIAAFRKNAAAAIFIVSLFLGLMTGIAVILKSQLIEKNHREAHRRKLKME